MADKSPYALEVRGVTKNYGVPPRGITALKAVFVNVLNNEFFTLLGPSDCGKKTLLRMIAGFEYLTAGEMLLHDSNIETQKASVAIADTVIEVPSTMAKVEATPIQNRS